MYELHDCCVALPTDQALKLKAGSCVQTPPISFALRKVCLVYMGGA